MSTVRASICILVLLVAVSMVAAKGWNVTVDVAPKSPDGQGHFWVVVQSENKRQGILLTNPKKPWYFRGGEHMEFGNFTVLLKREEVTQVGLRYQRLPRSEKLPMKAHFSKVTLVPNQDGQMDFCPPKGEYLEVGDDWVDFAPCK